MRTEHDSAPPLLRIESLHKAFGENKVLVGVSLDLHKQEKKVIIGPSGTGKSTLLRCINRLTPPDSGRIFLDGKEITSAKDVIRKARQEIGMVFQQFNLFAHLTTLRNITLGLVDVKGLSRKEADRCAMTILEQVGLTDKVSAYPAELSGGQQQRVGIARAVAMNPKLMLFDEPTSALDPELIGEVLDVIVELAREGMAMLLVTHEMGFARAVCDEIIFMEDGRIIEQAEPARFFSNPQEERTKRFLHKITELYGSAS